MNAIVSIVDVMPNAVRVRADAILPTDGVFTAVGDRIPLREVRALPKTGRVVTVRVDGWRDYWQRDEMVTVSRATTICVHCGCTRTHVNAYAAADGIPNPVCCLTADAPHPNPERHQS
jgi:hypothetical protein